MHRVLLFAVLRLAMHDGMGNEKQVDELCQKSWRVHSEHWYVVSRRSEDTEHC